MRIVVLDGAAMNPGDLSWSALEELGEITVYDHTGADEVSQRAASAEAVITNKTPLTGETIAHLPSLKYIGVTATGYDVVDTEAARTAGVSVTNVPAYATDAVAQATFALLLELTNHVGQLDRRVRTRWPADGKWCYWDEPIVELAGLTLGIIGFGRIGRAVGRIGRAFGMEILAADERKIDDANARQVDVDEVFAGGDVVTLHCPLTERTKGLVGGDRLSRMKPSAYLLNTSRGQLVDEQSLSDALAAGRLAGAGLDVLSSEPPAPDNPLLSAPRCVITPHVAWAAAAARRRLLGEVVENLRAFIDENPRNTVT
ncbi:MAG: D-2-hydroxyacid dehydrogenase [Planctomycetota bacterium]